MHLCRLAAIIVSTACTISATCEECKGAQEPPRSDAVVRDGSAGPRRCLSREVSSPTRHRLLCRGVPTPAGRLPFLYLVLNPRCRPTWGSLLRWAPCPHPTLLRNTRPGPPARFVLLKEGGHDPWHQGLRCLTQSPVSAPPCGAIAGASSGDIMESKGWQVTYPLHRRPRAALPFI